MYKYLMTMEPAPMSLPYWEKGIETVTSGATSMAINKANGWRGNNERLIQERELFIHNLEVAGVPTVVVPHPKYDWLCRKGMNNDIEYVRDPLICSSSSGEALLFNMGEVTRKKELDFHRRILKTLGINFHISEKGNMEGGNIRRYPIEGEEFLFVADSVRSDLRGIDEMAEFLEIPRERQLVLNILNGFHLDCALTGVFTPNERHLFTDLNAFAKDCIPHLTKFASIYDISVHHLAFHDAQDLSTNQVEFRTDNEHSVFFSEPFKNDRDINTFLTIDGISVYMSPLTQNRRTNGANHCLTQELWTKTPLDISTVNSNLGELKKEGVFSTDALVKIINNYTA